MRLTGPRLVLATMLTLTINGASAVAQTSTTNCSANGNYLNCTSNTSPSLEQQQQRQQEQLQQNLTQLGAVIAQRKAAAAAQQAAWAAAASEQARAAATVARGNYDATTAAMSRFLSDTAPISTPPLNADLVLDWSLLHGIETKYEAKGEGKIRWEAIRRTAWTDTPEGGKVLRLEESDEAIVKGDVMTTITQNLRFDPATGFMLLTREGKPRYSTVPPMYESTVRVGRYAFATRMNGQGFDIIAAPGALDKSLLYLAVAAIPGELPTAFRIWVVDTNGEVVPADIRVVGPTTLEVPLAPAGEGCAGNTARKKKMDALTLSVSVGASVETMKVLATAPHLAENPDIKCRAVGR